MADGVGNNGSPPAPTSSKCSQCLRSTFTWARLRYLCCQTRKDLRIFWASYVFMLIILFITFMVAFLLKSSVTIQYQGWYNDPCTIDVRTTSPMTDCDRTLRLYCSTVTEQCACLQNMFWNGSFCDCSPKMFYTGSNCQTRSVFGQACQTNVNSCMENLICSTSTNTCDCPSSSYYNQTGCQPRLVFNSTQPCSVSSQCVTGLMCSSNSCTCPTSQTWNGNGCSNSSAYGAYCSSAQPCDSTGLLVCNGTSSRCTCTGNSFWNGQICQSRLNNGSLCNNTQQCYSGLICQNNYCQCPLINTQYWLGLNLTCQVCFGPDLFLFDGICYRIPVPKNATVGTYATLSSSYPLSTIQYDYQLTYLFNQYVRVYNWTPIYFSTVNPLANYFQWSPDQTLIKPTYFCNDSVLFNSTGYALSFKLETDTPCLRAWPTTTIGQLASQLNNYVYHPRQ